MIRALFAAGVLALGGGAQAALIEVEFDSTIGSANFFESGGTKFFQIGQNLTLSPYGAIALNNGDTARVTFNFGAGQAVRVTDQAASPVEVAVSFLTAGQLVNPGPTQIDVTFDFTLTFLGASGDLTFPSIFRPNQRNIGGGFGPALAADLTGSSFLFQGVVMEFANIRDNNAAAGVTEANRLLPRNFDVTSFRIQSRGGVAQAQAVAVPEPSTFGLLAMSVIGLGGLLGRRLLTDAAV
jgi:hypothetical protein